MPATAEVNLAELNLPAPLPARYTDEAEFTASLELKAAPQPCDGLYPRDGTVTVTEVEEALSQLTIPDQRLNVVVGSGMAAVSSATLFALQHQGERAYPTRPALLHSRDLYPQSTKFFTGLKYMGVDTRTFDAGDPDSIGNARDERAPEVIVAETVANTPQMPVLDVHALLENARSQGEDGPIIVLDNTLPLSTGLDLSEILKPEDRVLVVESATKSAMHNSEHLGVVYGPNGELIDAFRKYKARMGVVTSTGADASILRALQLTQDSFHTRNRALFESTNKLAHALAAAQQEMGDDPEFTVAFPTFADHPNHGYADEHLLDGSSPVVFANCTDFHEGVARKLLRRISEHPRIREQIREGQIFIGQSFGFREATLLHDPNAPQIRVAGGYAIDSDALADALTEAAADV